VGESGDEGEILQSLADFLKKLRTFFLELLFSSRRLESLQIKGMFAVIYLVVFILVLGR
jgi:hypothetical protein